jgi:WD40 repeat protein
LGSSRFRGSHWLSSLAYTPDGKFLVGGSGKGVWIWDAVSGRMCRRLGREWSETVVLSPDGKLVAVMNDGGRNQCQYKLSPNGKMEGCAV